MSNAPLTTLWLLVFYICVFIGYRNEWIVLYRSLYVPYDNITIGRIPKSRLCLTLYLKDTPSFSVYFTVPWETAHCIDLKTLEHCIPLYTMYRCIYMATLTNIRPGLIAWDWVVNNNAIFYCIVGPKYRLSWQQTIHIRPACNVLSVVFSIYFCNFILSVALHFPFRVYFSNLVQLVSQRKNYIDITERDMAQWLERGALPMSLPVLWFRCRIFREILCFFLLNLGTLFRCCVLWYDTELSNASLHLVKMST